MTDSPITSNISTLRPYLSRFWKVHVSDGRILHGRCVACDAWMNLILDDTREYRFIDSFDITTSTSAPPPTTTTLKTVGTNSMESRMGHGGTECERRNVGVVMVPGKHIVRVEAEEYNLDLLSPRV